ncbi:hypothetical protein A2U01_0056420, partial [Trifolium medium]|nr:hypothetical protein [Trifolium medium]
MGGPQSSAIGVRDVVPLDSANDCGASKSVGEASPRVEVGSDGVTYRVFSDLVAYHTSFLVE